MRYATFLIAAILCGAAFGCGGGGGAAGSVPNSPGASPTPPPAGRVASIDGVDQPVVRFGPFVSQPQFTVIGHNLNQTHVTGYLGDHEVPLVNAGSPWVSDLAATPDGTNMPAMLAYRPGQLGVPMIVHLFVDGNEIPQPASGPVTVTLQLLN
jgi:hypothetical protein